MDLFVVDLYARCTRPPFSSAGLRYPSASASQLWKNVRGAGAAQRRTVSCGELQSGEQVIFVLDEDATGAERQSRRGRRRHGRTA